MSGCRTCVSWDLGIGVHVRVRLMRCGALASAPASALLPVIPECFCRGSSGLAWSRVGCAEATSRERPAVIDFVGSSLGATSLNPRQNHWGVTKTAARISMPSVGYSGCRRGIPYPRALTPGRSSRDDMRFDEVRHMRGCGAMALSRCATTQRTPPAHAESPPFGGLSGEAKVAMTSSTIDVTGSPTTAFGDDAMAHRRSRHTRPRHCVT